MDSIANFFSSIPHLVWGSLITFAGVIYADSRNSRRADRQNRFSAEQSDKERLMALRKEVYLETPASFLRMQTQLFGLVNFHDAKVSNTEASDITDVMAKVALVSSSATAILAERIAVDYGVTHSRLLLEAEPARDAHVEQKQCSRFKELAVKEYERVAAEVKHELESGQANETRVAALKISLKHAERSMRKAEKAEIESAENVAHQSYEFLRKARDASLPLVELSIQLTVALRWELGQSTDHEQYKREMKRGRDAFLRTTDESLASLKNYISGVQK